MTSSTFDKKFEEAIDEHLEDLACGFMTGFNRMTGDSPTSVNTVASGLFDIGVQLRQEIAKSENPIDLTKEVSQLFSDVVNTHVNIDKELAKEDLDEAVHLNLIVSATHYGVLSGLTSDPKEDF